jgi:tetratricopeptide (TPR) repeat protein
VYWNASGQQSVEKALGLSHDDVYAKANAYLAEAETHPSPSYYQMRADRLIYQHKSDEAIAAAERAIALDPSDPDGYVQMSVALGSVLN